MNTKCVMVSCKERLLFLCLIFTFTQSAFVLAQSDTLLLDGDHWQIQMKGDSNTWLAKVPGYTLLDLSRAGELPPLFSPEFEAAALPYCDSTWVYSSNFEWTEKGGKKQKCSLVFEGLDTYADLYLNDVWIGRSGNMFLPLTLDVGAALRNGENTLKVHILPVARVAQEQYDAYGDSLPESARVMARKAAYMFGWDWAPSLPAAGIWKSVYLVRSETTPQNVDVHIRTTLSIDLDTGYVHLSFDGLESNSTLFASLYHENRRLDRKPLVSDRKEELIWAIPSPKLWWPAPHGEPTIYSFTLELESEAQTLIKKSFKTGFRKVELDTSADARGAAFLFKINNKPVYMKGANWVPAHFFPSEVTEEDYRSLLQLASDAHINMLRVWGGGIYESDAFYALCDSLGIAVWQDFMFACAMYPDHPGFLSSVQREATHHIKRLSKHPGLVMWCGNNESAEGWSNWGWKQGRRIESIAKIERAYVALFHELLPDLLRAYHPELPYWPSSPKLGRGSVGYLDQGDAHDWYVWHDGYPFSHFIEKVPRFMSEFGFQSYPSIRMMNGYTSIDPNASAQDLSMWLPYQKHRRGTEIINQYMERDLPTPQNQNQLVYLSQWMQARGISEAIMAQRASQPWCMGSLVWQWNDCWPAVSWSAIDFSHRPKALYYAMQYAMKPFTCWVSPQGKIYMMDDLGRGGNCEVKLQSMHSKETLLHVKDKIAGGAQVYSWSLEQFEQVRDSVLQLQILFNDEVCNYNYLPIDKRDWLVSTEPLPMDLRCKKSKCTLSIYSEKPRFGAQIEIEGGEFKTGYVDIIPGRKYIWTFNKAPNMSTKNLRSKIKLNYMNLAIK